MGRAALRAAERRLALGEDSHGARRARLQLAALGSLGLGVEAAVGEGTCDGTRCVSSAREIFLAGRTADGGSAAGCARFSLEAPFSTGAASADGAENW